MIYFSSKALIRIREIQFLHQLAPQRHTSLQNAIYFTLPRPSTTIHSFKTIRN